MLALLLVQGLTGLFANDEIASAGPFYGWVSHEWSNRLSRLHRANEYWLLGLIVLHLAAVAWYALVRRRPLVRAMITGGTDVTSDRGAGPLRGAMIRRALLIAVGISALLAVLIALAPKAVPVLF